MAIAFAGLAGNHFKQLFLSWLLPVSYPNNVGTMVIITEATAVVHFWQRDSLLLLLLLFLTLKIITCKHAGQQGLSFYGQP